MQFRPKTREYWMKVKPECAWETYNERDGFVECGKMAQHLHHIIPQVELLMEGKDPNSTTGLPLCENHHVRNFGDTPFEYGSSMHPDVAQDYAMYGPWKQQAQHLAEISNKPIDYSTSPFSDIGVRHRQMVENGERVCTGDEFTDRHYTEKMVELAIKYNVKHEVVKKHYKEHPKYDSQKRKRWYDSIIKQFE